MEKHFADLDALTKSGTQLQYKGFNEQNVHLFANDKLNIGYFIRGGLPQARVSFETDTRFSIQLDAADYGGVMLVYKMMATAPFVVEGAQNSAVSDLRQGSPVSPDITTWLLFHDNALTPRTTDAKRKPAVLENFLRASQFVNETLSNSQKYRQVRNDLEDFGHIR